MKNFTVRAEKYFGMGIFSLFVLILSIFTACKQPTWNDPVREYLEYYTETAAVEDFAVVQSYLIDKDGNICISSFGEETKEILLYMRNPKKFPITASGITGSDVTIVQDTDDPTVLHLTYSHDYLLNHECGGDIGGVISLTENVTPRDMPDSYDLKLKCNSAPDKIEDAAVMRCTDGDTDTFVIAFVRPSPFSCSNWNRDIVSITINGEAYPVSINSSGVMTFSDPRFTTTEPTLLPINRTFDNPIRTPVYFLTGEPFVEGNKSYTIGFNDEAGLSSRITVDTAVARLSAPTVVKNNDDNNLYTTSSVNYLHTDSDGAEQSTVRIYVPTDDEIGNPVSNVTLHYELYKGGYSDTVTRIVPNGDNPGTYTGTNPVDVVLPDEDAYYLVTWASNPDHTDSAKIKYKLNLQYAQLKAPDVKDLGDNLLSSTAANNYIKLDEGQLYATVKVSVPNETTTNVAVGSGVTVHYTLSQGTEIADDAVDHPITSQTSLQDTTFGQWCLKVKATKTGYRDSEEKTYLIKAFSSDIWVESTADGGNDTTGDGTSAHPYATIQRAVTEIATYNKPTVDYTVHVIGTIKGSQTVSSALDGKAAKLTLTGENNNGVLDGNRSSNNKGTTLTVSTTVPVTIEHLTIKGGYYPYNDDSGNGGGIKISNGATVKLASGAKISGNEARCGGGVYVEGGANLFMYGDVLIGDAPNASNVATEGSRANRAHYGGGIYCNGGTIYMGYSAVDTPEPVSANYGIKRNYSTYWGGGVSLKGTMYIASGDISLNYVKAGGNTGNGGDGGGIYLESNGLLNISGGIIKGNQSEYRGGGIYVTSTNNGSYTLTMSGNTIESNTSDSNGGAIFTNRVFSMSGSAYIKYGGSAKNNDVYLGSGSINLSNLTPPSSCTDGVVATVCPSSYSESTTIISTGKNYAPSLAVVPDSSTSPPTDWRVSSSTGKLQKVIVLTSSNALSVTMSGGNTNFMADSSFTASDLDTFLSRTMPTGVTISLDLSRTSITSLPTTPNSTKFNSEITSLTLPNNYHDARNFVDALWSNRTLAEVIISGANSALATEDGILYRRNSSTGKKVALIYYPPAKSGTSYTLPTGVTILAPRCFMFNQNLESITNLTQIKTFEENGYGNHFRECQKLKQIDLRNVTTVGPLQKSSFGSFCDCPDLESVTLSSAFTQIDGGWFNFASDITSSLKSVHLKSTTPPTIGNWCDSSNKCFYNCNSALKIYVPSSARSAYLNATSGFANSNYNGVAGSLSSILVGE
ncbi:MAG: leucine-rich repeat protein [Treponema sp.]|nr:leucine-rich repeat protein [Treponema sp.]